MPLRKAEITGHAWQQFLQRWEGPRPHNFRDALVEIMAEAQEEEIGYHGVIRMLNNDMVPARYFITPEWRFVTNEDVTAVLTIERPRYRGTIKGRRKKRRQKV